LSQIQDDSATAVVEDRAYAEKLEHDAEGQRKSSLDR
jgi:hypothetical protein